ncbi:MAG: hypothetical protein ABL982_24390, partial [Vicinamibacterales bacterium]
IAATLSSTRPPGARPTAASGSPADIRVWDLALRDKANAWNQYVHDIWPDADRTFFVDGYISVAPDALGQLSTSLDNSPDALAAAALPSVGRSAEELRAWFLRAPQIHGSLYALRGETLDRLRRERFRVPLGLYRIDSLIGSSVNFNFSPATDGWNTQRIAVNAAATWRQRVGSPWNYSDLRTALLRTTRQAFGRLEELAIRDHLERQQASPMRLPHTSQMFVWQWMRRHPLAAIRTVAGRPLALIGCAQNYRRKDWPLQSAPPRLLFPACSETSSGRYSSGSGVYAAICRGRCRSAAPND